MQDGLWGFQHKQVILLLLTFLLPFMHCFCEFWEVGDIRHVCAPHLAVVRKYPTVGELH